MMPYETDRDWKGRIVNILPMCKVLLKYIPNTCQGSVQVYGISIRCLPPGIMGNAINAMPRITSVTNIVFFSSLRYQVADFRLFVMEEGDFLVCKMKLVALCHLLYLVKSSSNQIRDSWIRDGYTRDDLQIYLKQPLRPNNTASKTSRPCSSL